MNYIAKGKMIYAHERTAKFFHACKSKNIAHRLAVGKYVVTLDADNYIGQSISLIRQAIAKFGDAMFHMGVHSATNRRILDGTYGRIGMPRWMFESLGGYDESFLPMGYQDTDILARGVALGYLKITPDVVNPGFDASRAITAIKNHLPQKTSYTGSSKSFHEMNRINQLISKANIKKGALKANPEGWGQATLWVDFERELVLK